MPFIARICRSSLNSKIRFQSYVTYTSVRRTISILMALMVLGPMTLIYYGFTIKRAQLRHEIKHRLMMDIDTSELITFRFSQSERQTLKWEHSREFEYRGTMYDVVKSYAEGDIQVYVCWPDEEESELNQTLTRLTEERTKQDQQNQQQSEQVWRFAQSLFFAEYVMEINYTSIHTSSTNYWVLTSHWSAIPLFPESPPPRG